MALLYTVALQADRDLSCIVGPSLAGGLRRWGLACTDAKVRACWHERIG